MKNIEKIREGLYIKKDRLGYRIVYPYKNDDGTINWFNVLTGGSWGNLIKVVLIVSLILFVTWGYYHDTKACKDFMENPCEMLPNISKYCLNVENLHSQGTLDITNFKEVNINGET